MKNKKVQGVIFDMDGLMFNTEDLFLIADKEVVKKYGKILPMKTFRKLQGLRAEEAMEVFKNDLGIEESSQKLFAQRNPIYEKLLSTKLQPMPGLFELIKFLKKENLKTAVATSSIDVWLKIINKKYKLKKYFSIIITGDQVKKGKPDPEIFLKAASKLKIKPQNLLVLEDAINGLEAAKRGGFQCAMVRDQFHQQSKFKGADLVVTKLDSQRLFKYIKK